MIRAACILWFAALFATIPSFAPRAAAQDDVSTRLRRTIESSLDGTPVGFEYAYSTDLASTGSIRYETHGIFDGPGRIAFELATSRWRADRVARFYGRAERTAFLDPLRPEGWHLFTPAQDQGMDPIYRDFVDPRAVLDLVARWPRELRTVGRRFSFETPCTAYESEFDREAVSAIVASLGTPIPPDTTIEECEGRLTFLVGADDSLLHSIELRLEVVLQLANATPDPPSPTPDPREASSRSDGEPPPASNGISPEEFGRYMGTGPSTSTKRRTSHVSIAFVLERTRNGKPIPPHIPDPAAARLVE